MRSFFKRRTLKGNLWFDSFALKTAFSDQRLRCVEFLTYCRGIFGRSPEKVEAWASSAFSAADYSWIDCRTKIVCLTNQIYKSDRTSAFNRVVHCVLNRIWHSFEKNCNLLLHAFYECFSLSLNHSPSKRSGNHYNDWNNKQNCKTYKFEF